MNWVSCKEQFLLMVEACLLLGHLDGNEAKLTFPFVPALTPPLTADQTAAIEKYQRDLQEWKAAEVVIKQGMASTIPETDFMSI
jgi:hypothetical protein